MACSISCCLCFLSSRSVKKTGGGGGDEHELANLESGVEQKHELSGELKQGSETRNGVGLLELGC